MNELMNLGQKKTMTSLEVAEITGKRHDNILADIRDEINKLGLERAVLIFQEGYYLDKNNQTRPKFDLNYRGILQLGARYSAETRFKLIQKAEELSNQDKPMTIEDMIILQANEMKTVKTKVDILENKIDNEIRIDSGEQRKLQRAVSVRVYQRLEVINSDSKYLFPAIYRDLKDRFGIASYRDLKRKDLKEALAYIQNWIEKADLREAN
ncbi:Rha family transcriptional regulator [Pseudoleptotrichia goodfellowii]|uniref:Phage regulatory protein, Rha family n=1 Tax=Pseudoleptotrichia goodfellowii F0264 TaxID=596323 RepID=D0GNZ3_9FUSO|nr:Rha family transcriptional regulator [Pseudoleptotrichia goodfellowii]EEY34192.1 phage regulatory protein, Rha family [Pseudoleptotrichia goodfellowii F0264]